MNTSSEAAERLQQALKTTREAADIINNLIATHDYQDVAELVTQAAAELLQAAVHLMESQDETALERLETAEDLMDAVYDTIESDLDA